MIIIHVYSNSHSYWLLKDLTYSYYWYIISYLIVLRIDMFDNNLDVMFNGGNGSFLYRLISIKEYTIGNFKSCVEREGVLNLYIWVYDSDGNMISVIEEDMFSDRLLRECGVVGDDINDSIVYRFVYVEDMLNGLLNIYYEGDDGVLSWVGKEWNDDDILGLVWNLA